MRSGLVVVNTLMRRRLWVVRCFIEATLEHS